MIDIKAGQQRGVRYAMIGPLPPPIGGTTVSFAALCDYLRSQSVECTLIDTVRRSGGTVSTGLFVVRELLRVIRSCDVVTAHFSDRAAITIAPALWAICKLLGKPFVFRQFGGEFDRTFWSLRRWQRWLVAKTILQSDAVFLQTKTMVREFTPFSNALHWFPTARRRLVPSYRGTFANGNDRSLRCLFFGHVSKAKGALLAARAVKSVEGVTLDVYGPLVDLQLHEFVSDRVSYRGIAAPSDVEAVMSGYDLLLFPTSHSGEGYSGTLVEAAMVGLPMIVTRWQSLPEMFAEDEAIFVDAMQVGQISDALRAVIAEPTSLLRYSNRLVSRASDYDAEYIFERFRSVCTNIAIASRN